MTVVVAGDDVLLSFSLRPPTRGRPPPWVAHRQLGSCLPPFQHLLTLVHRRVLLNGRCFARIVNGSHGRERSFEREKERDLGREREELVVGRRSSPEFDREKWRSTTQVDVRQNEKEIVKEREISLFLLC